MENEPQEDKGKFSTGFIAVAGLALLVTKKMADGMSQEEAMKATMEEVAEQMGKPRSKEEIEESARQVEKLFGRTCVCQQQSEADGRQHPCEIINTKKHKQEYDNVQENI